MFQSSSNPETIIRDCNHAVLGGSDCRSAARVNLNFALANPLSPLRTLWLRQYMQFDQLNRRDFIVLVGSGSAGWPLVANAQHLRSYLGSAISPISGARIQRRCCNG
jgi:hypothetical protein